MVSICSLSYGCTWEVEKLELHEAISFVLSNLLHAFITQWMQVNLEPIVKYNMECKLQKLVKFYPKKNRQIHTENLRNLLALADFKCRAVLLRVTQGHRQRWRVYGTVPPWASHSFLMLTCFHKIVKQLFFFQICAFNWTSFILLNHNFSRGGRVTGTSAIPPAPTYTCDIIVWVCK